MLPFGLRRRIFVSLIASMLTAGALTYLLSSVWKRSAVAVALCVGISLWFASGRLAFRLVRPLNRLVDVVQRLGQGDLSARASFPPNRRDEVTRVARAIDQMAEAIERKRKEESELLAAVSHELRTPMARIRVLTDLVRSGQQESLDQIDREVEDVDALVANLLARSRLEFGNLSRKPIRLPDAVSEALERAGRPGSDLLKVSGDRAYDAVSADPTLLHRAIANLIDNAQQHGGGLTGVEVHSDAKGVAVEVLDDGPGFPEDALPENRFQAFAAPNGSSDRRGLGLGLHLVQRIIEAQGGRVWAENVDQGKGARVGFEIPFEQS